jgi:hypothetical protein
MHEETGGKMPIHFYLRKTCHECDHAIHLHIGELRRRWQFFFSKYENILESVSDWKEHIAQQTTNGWQLIDEDGMEHSPAVFWSLVEAGCNGKLRGRHSSPKGVERNELAKIVRVNKWYFESRP